MSRDKILMCPPDFFSVDYVINPWMAGHEDSFSLDRAKQQWDRLHEMLGEFADIVTMDPQPDLPDIEAVHPGRGALPDDGRRRSMGRSGNAGGGRARGHQAA